MADAAPGLAVLHDGPTPSERLAPARHLPDGVGASGATVRRLPRDQLGPKPPRRREAARQKRGDQTGPRPVERGQCGTAVHRAGDARAMPLGAVVSGANANAGGQTEGRLRSRGVRPPEAVVCVIAVELQSLPRAHAAGADGNRPPHARAPRAGVRLQAPTRGEARPGVGKSRTAVERCQNLFAQGGRGFRRCDRSSRRYVAWVEMAACIILLRSGFVS
jgi:hypothetical protein